VEPSINLTPHRGPSVWETPAERARPLHLAAAATGAAITALAWRTAPPRRFWIAGLGAAGAVAALMATPLGGRAEKALASVKAKRRAAASEPLDKTLKDTFPASDAPAVW
jgi:hypothetical protein